MILILKSCQVTKNVFETTVELNFHIKTVVITGCNTGIGKETVLDMAGRGARVVMACRDMDRAKAAADDIKQRCDNADLVLYK